MRRGSTTVLTGEAGFDIASSAPATSVKPMGRPSQDVMSIVPSAIDRRASSMSCCSSPQAKGGGYQETPIFLGSDLRPGHEVPGPAIIEETFTTIVVYPGWKAHVDDAGDYELTRV
jgi:N-methylhydantoinase A/oxoprolinase/acetone carboxylase beta subunit